MFFQAMVLLSQVLLQVFLQALNGIMWDHPATQANAATLAARPQHRIIGPAEDGMLACGTSGKGRLVPEDAIVQEILASLPS